MEVGQISVGLTGSITSLQGVLAQARRESENTARAMGQSFDRLNVGDKMGAGIKQTTSMLGPLTAALGAAGIAAASIHFGREAIQTGMEFQHTMKIVQAITQSTADEFAELNKVAKGLGATTEFTAKQAAEGLKILGQAGLNAKLSMEALPGVLDLATIGELGLAEAAETAVAAVNAFRLPMEQMGRVNDVIAKAAIATNVDVKDMAEAFKYAAPAAAAFGYSIEELSGYIGLLGNLGIKGSMAGTQLSFSFQKVPDLFKKLGMDGEGKKLIDALELINTKGLKTGEILDVFGDRGGRAALGLSTLTGQYKDFVGQLEKAEGTSKEMAATIRSSVLGSYKELESTIEGIEIDVFSRNQGQIHKGLKDITQSLRDMKPLIVDVSQGFVNFFMMIEPYTTGMPRKFADANTALEKFGISVYAWARDAWKGQDQLNKEMVEYDDQLRRVNKQYKEFKTGETHMENMNSLLRNAVENWKQLTATDKWMISAGIDPKTEKALEKINTIVNEMFKGDPEAIGKIKEYLKFRADTFGVTESDVRKQYASVIETIKASFPKEKHKEMIEFISSQFESKFDIELNPKIKTKPEDFPRHEMMKMVEGWNKTIRSFREKEMGIETYDLHLKYMEGDVEKLKKIRDKAKEVYGEMGDADSDYHRRASGRAEIGPYDAERVKKSLKEMEEGWKEHGETLQKLTEDTFESMRETVSEVYFKVLEGDLKNFEDVYENFMRSLKKITSDYFAQMTIEGLFGEKGQGGGFLSKLFSGSGGSGISGWLSSIIGLFGGGGGTTSNAVGQSSTMGIVQALATVKHEGGDYYKPGALMRPATGLASDEYLTILKKTEVVSNPDGMRSSGNQRSILNLTSPITIVAPKSKVTSESVSQVRAGIASEILLAHRRNV